MLSLRDEYRRKYLLRAGRRGNGEDALRAFRQSLAEAAEHNYQPQRQVHIHQHADGLQATMFFRILQCPVAIATVNDSADAVTVTFYLSGFPLRSRENSSMMKIPMHKVVGSR